MGTGTHGEIHSVAREILHSPPHLEQEGERLLRGTKRLYAGEVAQWQQVEDEGCEIEETACSLRETGEYDGFHTAPDEESDESGTETSHRRRRMLAGHHKEFIGEGPRDSRKKTSTVLWRWGEWTVQAHLHPVPILWSRGKVNKLKKTMARGKTRAQRGAQMPRHGPGGYKPGR